MTTIFIDNEPYSVKAGANLLHACLDLGFDVPYFCWHPALHSVGACRLCAVKEFRDANDSRGRIVMSCMTPVAENMRISLDDPEVKKFRAGIIALLMLNHPHDCPVCDEGGECHLQDMTVMTGHVERRYRFKKRTYLNQYLGPFLNHEMNRCIHCYRCVRFYRDYAGGRDLEAFASHRYVYFGRQEEGVLENVFSGNLAEVCPTGVFTDKTFKRHFTRAWDLQTAPSLCVHCGLGCNTLPGERYGLLRRIRNRYHSAVNGYFLCDRGRFGYEFVNHSDRITEPLRRKTAAHLATGGALPSPDDLTIALCHLLRAGRLLGIGSPRASLEANYALRTLVGPESFYAGIDEREDALLSRALQILESGPAPAASLQEASLSDAVFILGEDVTNTAPLLALALRQAVRNKPRERTRGMTIPDWNDTICRIAEASEKSPLFIATPAQTALDELAARTCRAAPADLARLGFAVAHAIYDQAPPVPDLSAEQLLLADTIACALKEAKRPLVVSGLASGSEAILEATANIAWALRAAGNAASLCLAMPEANSLGLGLLGAAGLGKAFASAATEKVVTAIILENDLYRRAGEEEVNRFFQACTHVIVIDSLKNETTEQADLLLPAGVFAESTGTMVSSEGRAQQFFKVYAPAGSIEEGVRWLCRMLSLAGRPEGDKWQTVSDITAALAEELPVFAPLGETVPLPSFRVAGQKIPRQTHRASGRTAISADQTVHEPPPPADPDSPLAFSMEGYGGMPPPALLTRYWSPGWNSVQALTKFQSEVGGPLQGGDPGVRLLEPGLVREPSFFAAPPVAFAAPAETWLLVARRHIFGSEELSARAPAIAGLAPSPYLALHPEDAARLGVREGEEVRLVQEGRAPSIRLPVSLDPSLPLGVAGVPAGLPSLPWLPLPAWGKIVTAREGTKGHRHKGTKL